MKPASACAWAQSDVLQRCIILRRRRSEKAKAEALAQCERSVIWGFCRLSCSVTLCYRATRQLRLLCTAAGLPLPYLATLQQLWTAHMLCCCWRISKRSAGRPAEGLDRRITAGAAAAAV
jgi:hypothetical protein